MPNENESQRLSVLRSYRVLDTPPERSFDRITLLAAYLLHAPIALISLVDEDRIWFKSRIGVEVTEVRRLPGFCATGFLADGVHEVPDTWEDPVAREHPMALGDPACRFYAAAPILASTGQRLGTVCVFDHSPRRLTAAESRCLEELAGIVMNELELRETARQLREAQQALEDRVAERTAALARSEEHFRSLIQHAQDIITVLDEQGVIRYQSPSIERILGWGTEDLLGQSAFGLIHPEDLARVNLAYGEAALDPERARLVEFRFRHRDGSWRNLEAIGRRVLRPDGSVGLVVNSRDISERRTLERQLFQAQKLESIGLLAGGIAHDFNNLLTAILGSVELAHADLGQDHPASADLQLIRQSASRAASLTQQLLLFARRQVGEPRVTDLNEVAHSVERMLRRLIGEDIEFRTHLAPVLWPVRIDPAQVEQVLINLAVNARDAMPAGGQLTLETRNLSVGPDRQEIGTGDWVVVSMSDSGSGMSEEVKARIFDPFFTTKEAGKGTGLGLATCYGIVTEAGGRIVVETAPGAGTRFDVYLPRALTATEDRGVPVESSPDGGQETVLLVEDEAAVRSVARRMLTRLGYRVREAPDGKAALDLLLADGADIDLILTDVVMPRLGGVALYHALRDAGRLRPMVFTSGYPGRDDPDESLPEGAVLLPKPWRSEALATAIRQALGG